MPTEHQNVLCSKRSLQTHTIVGYCTPRHHPHAYLRSYTASLRHIPSSLLTTFLSVFPRSTFRELECLEPTTSVRSMVIFVFSESTIRWSMQASILSPCTQAPTTAAAAWAMLCSPSTCTCSCSAHCQSGSAIGSKFCAEGPCNEQGRCPSALARWSAVCLGAG